MHSLGLIHRERSLGHKPHQRIVPSFQHFITISTACGCSVNSIRHISEKEAGYELSAVKTHSSRAMGTSGQEGDLEGARVSPETAGGKTDTCEGMVRPPRVGRKQKEAAIPRPGEN